MSDVVVDASAIVDLLLANEFADGVRQRVSGHAMHAPSHLDAEVLSALGRLHRAGELEAEAVEAMLRLLVAAPIDRHPVTDLVVGTWSRRHQLRLVDAVYVELAVSLEGALVTTDQRLRDAPNVAVVS